MGRKRREAKMMTDAELHDAAEQQLREQGLVTRTGDVVSTTPDPPRHPPGRGSGVTFAEATEIRMAFLTEAPSVSELARRFGRTRETVGGLLKGAEFDALQKEVREDRKRRALELLHSNQDQFAEDWIEASKTARAKGNHHPARDALLHTDVIKPVVDGEGDGPRVLVQIGVKDGDVRIALSPDASGSLAGSS